MPKQLKFRVLAITGGLALIVGIGVLAALPASGSSHNLRADHTGTVSGIATCEANGTYTVDWSLVTAAVPVGDTAIVTQVAATPVNASGFPLAVVGNTSVGGINQMGISGTATSATLKVHLSWTGATAYTATSNLGVVTLGGNCVAIPPPPTTTTVPAPTTTTTAPVSVPVPVVTSPPVAIVPPSSAPVAPPVPLNVLQPATTPASIALSTGATAGNG